MKYAGKVGPVWIFFTPRLRSGKKYNDSLLLIPGNVIDYREIVYTLKAQSLLKGHSDDYERIGVVTLAGVKYPRHTLDVAQRQLVIAIFGTTLQ